MADPWAERPDAVSSELGAAHLKLASVATDPLGASGRAMWQALIGGDHDPEKLAELSRGKLWSKIPQLPMAGWESAGKRKSGRIRKSSAWLRRHLSQSAWGVSTKQNNYLSALFRRIAARRGVKRATIAVAHAILVIAYHVLKTPVDYRDLGPD